MFRDACTAARGYTFPVIIPSRKVNGECAAGLGAFIILNSDGWFLTAAHIGDELSKLSASVTRINERAGKEAEIRADKSLSPPQRRKKLRELGKTKPTDVCNFGVLWSNTGATVNGLRRLAHVDLGVGKLEDVDMSKFSVFPKFHKEHDQSDVGVTVCRSGFPFHSIETSWDDASNSFTFPNGIFPVPMFANEGIISRFIAVVVEDEDPPLGYDRRLFETSTPGLRGQSGGPIFDADGRIWGIQSRTTSYELGFSPEVKGKPEHQFLNVGMAVDSCTVCSFLDGLGISYQTE